VPDLSITALYTSQVWAWGQLSCAELLASSDGKRVFDVTNAALAVMRRGAPLRIALLHRHLMIDHMLREAGATRVVELAAGLSRRGAAITADPGVRYVEIDLPAVIARKRELLARTPEGRTVLARDNLALVAGNLESIELAPLAGDAPIVIAEGIAMYLDSAARRQLFARIAALPGARFVFDLVPANEEPPAGWTGRMLEAAMKRFTGGRTFERDARTREDVLRELRAAGFAEAVAVAAADVARAWRLPHADQRTSTVVFSARALRSISS
jgi:O-methyltransferase involved in polyketide biosynthesis